MDDFMSTQEVAATAGVGTTAVKRWSDAGLLTCVRTAGGHRRFARAEVQRFLRERGAEPGAPPTARAWTERILDAGDPRELEGHLLMERARLGAWHRVCEPLAAAVTELGARWAAGTITILEEHLASERLARALARAAEGVVVAPAAPVAMLACAEADEHTLGLSMVELCLREAGWATRWAGRKTPAAELLVPVRDGTIALLALSASEASSDAEELRAQAEMAAAACRAAGVALVLGGAGRWPSDVEGAERFHGLEALHHWASRLRERRAAAV